MNAINFKQANAIFTADGCDDLPVDRGINSYYNLPSLTSCWEPTDEEIKYIKQCIENNEKPKIYLDILGTAQPPVWIGCNLYKEDNNNEK